MPAGGFVTGGWQVRPTSQWPSSIKLQETIVNVAEQT
jgi:hypothetical protein